jgi:integrase/recombinase XerD
MTAASLDASSPAVLPSEAEDFLLWLTVEKGRSPATLAAYRRDLRAWTAHLERRGRTVATADESDVISHLRALQATGKKPASVARAMVAVRALHSFMVADELRIDDPTAHVEMPSVPRGLPKPLTMAEIERLLESIPTDDAVGRRDKAMIEVLYGTGIRISELVGTSLGDLDMRDALLRVYGKGAKERVVPLGSFAHASLTAWLSPGGRSELEPRRWADRSDAEALWLNQRGGRLSRQGAWGIVKRRAAAVGLGATLSPHVFRHSCATHMLDNGADIRTVQELLGHASVTTTQVYTRVSNERLWTVYAAAHPRGHRG